MIEFSISKCLVDEIKDLNYDLFEPRVNHVIEYYKSIFTNAGNLYSQIIAKWALPAEASGERFHLHLVKTNLAYGIDTIYGFTK